MYYTFHPGDKGWDVDTRLGEGDEVVSVTVSRRGVLMVDYGRTGLAGRTFDPRSWWGVPQRVRPPQGMGTCRVRGLLHVRPHIDRRFMTGPVRDSVARTSPHESVVDNVGRRSGDGSRVGTVVFE